MFSLAQFVGKKALHAVASLMIGPDCGQVKNVQTSVKNKQDKEEETNVVMRTRQVSRAAQVWTALCAPTSIGAWEKDGNVFQLFVGSVYNVCTMKVDDFDFYVNCCAEFGSFAPTKTFQFRLRDNNLIDIQVSRRSVKNLIMIMERHAKLRTKTTGDDGAQTPFKVLVYSSEGCSRAPAIAVLVAASLSCAFDFNKWHNLLKCMRPSVNMSCALKTNATRILQELESEFHTQKMLKQ